MFYSDDETLEQASEHKLESMYGALQSKPGMRLLDIGAGWGGVHQYCGPRGIHVTALTLTEDSYNYTDSLIKRLELKNCSVILEDFLNHHPEEPTTPWLSMALSSIFPSIESSANGRGLVLSLEDASIWTRPRLLKNTT